MLRNEYTKRGQRTRFSSGCEKVSKEIINMDTNHHTLYKSRLSSTQTLIRSEQRNAALVMLNSGGRFIYTYQNQPYILDVHLLPGEAKVDHQSLGWQIPCEAWLRYGCTLFWPNSQ